MLAASRTLFIHLAFFAAAPLAVVAQNAAGIARLHIAVPAFADLEHFLEPVGGWIVVVHAFRIA